MASHLHPHRRPRSASRWLSSPSGVAAALVVATASCGQDVEIGDFERDATSGGDAGGLGGAAPGGTTGGPAVVETSATTSSGPEIDANGEGGGGASQGGAGGADGGFELEPSGTPEAYLAACQGMYDRTVELEQELGCETTNLTSWGLCESGFASLSYACKLGMVPVVECYTATVESRDCFCESALECSYYPTCDALFDGPSDCWEEPGPIFGGAACGAEHGDCDGGQYCDFSDDLCGAGETIGVCRPITSCTSPWTDVCGCDGQPYAELCDALLVGVDIDAAGSCGVAP